MSSVQQFTDPEAAHSAIRNLDRKEFKGRVLRVDYQDQEVTMSKGAAFCFCFFAEFDSGFFFTHRKCSRKNQMIRLARAPCRPKTMSKSCQKPFRNCRISKKSKSLLK